MTDRDLISACFRIQAARGWSNHETAGAIGVARSTWEALTGEHPRAVYPCTIRKLQAFAAAMDQAPQPRTAPNLRQRLDALALSRSELASAAGVSVSTVFRFGIGLPVTSTASDRMIAALERFEIEGSEARSLIEAARSIAEANRWTRREASLLIGLPTSTWANLASGHVLRPTPKNKARLRAFVEQWSKAAAA
jgi:hypothetical protein